MHAAHQQLSPGQATPLPQGSRSQTSIPYPNIDSSGVQNRDFVAESSSPHPLSFSHKDRARCRSLCVPSPGEKENAECTDPPNLPDREPPLPPVRTFLSKIRWRREQDVCSERNRGWKVVVKEGVRWVVCFVEILSRRSSRPGQHFEILPSCSSKYTPL